MKRFCKENRCHLLLVFLIISSLLFLSSCGGISTTTYTITATAGVGGSINPSGVITVNKGDSCSFAFTTDTCYQIEELLVDGVLRVPIGGIYRDFSFDDIQENHTISVQFSSTGPGVHNQTKGTDYSSIQAAINDSRLGDILIVCPGTYYESITLHNKNITLRSTDPANPSTIEATIIRATTSDSVVQFSGGDTSTLSGFTITNGNAAPGSGGGINIVESNPTIKNNVIKNNKASMGGGIYVSNSSPTIKDNAIFNNKVENSGGGICIFYYSSPNIEGNIITENTAGFDGGGIFLSWSRPTLKNNIISENYAKEYGGGIKLCIDSTLLPEDTRPTGWGTSREHIPNSALVPPEEEEYTIAGNKFSGNKHGTPPAYTEGAHVY